MNAHTPHISAEDDFVHDLPGDLSHLFHISTVAPIDHEMTDTAALITSSLSQSGAAVAAIQSSRCADRQQHRVKITGVGPAHARTLAARLARLPGIHHVAVEHMISR